MTYEARSAGKVRGKYGPMLKRYFSYENGDILWTRSQGGKRAGDKAGGLVNGRLVVSLDGQRFNVRDIVWLLCRGRWPEKRLHHVDGNPLNVHIQNLTQDPRKVRGLPDVADVAVGVSSEGYFVFTPNENGLQIKSAVSSVPEALALVEAALIRRNRDE